MIPHSRARDNLAEFVSVDKKISALESIGINDSGHRIRFRLARPLNANKAQRTERLECIERGSTVDELLKFLGPFCPDITNAVQKSTECCDTYEPLINALREDIYFNIDSVVKIVGCTFDDFDVEPRDINDMRAMKPSNETLRRIGSITFQYTIAMCKQNAWVAIEKLNRIDALCQSVSLPVVFELHDPHGFHDRFSLFPGIAAQTSDAVYIIELEDAAKSHRGSQCKCGAKRNPCRENELNKAFIPIEKLTTDADGNVFIDGKQANFVFRN